MADQHAVPANWLKSLRWSAAAILTMGLAFGAAHTAHASTHVAAHTSSHMADGHNHHGKNNDGNNGGNNNDGNNNNGNGDGGNGDGNGPGSGVATPELGSSELLALGLVPVLGTILYTRARRRSERET